jgi:CheY-like chemotaxis protein
MLLPYSLKIETAANGLEAVDRIKNGNVYSVILMDQMMPKMNGMEATKIIREMGYNHPIVALTANAVAGSSEMFLTNGFDGYISKPIDIRELNAHLNRWIRDKQPPEVIEAARRQAVEENAGSGKKPFIYAELAATVVRSVEGAIDVLEGVCREITSGTGADIDLYTITVHGMKSALANIGEAGLSEIALKLEHAGDCGNLSLVSAEIPVFIDALKPLLKKFKRSKTDREEVSPEDLAFLRDGLKEIKAACESYEIEAAKTALSGLKLREWPGGTNELLDEISMALLRGELKKVVSATGGALK